MSEKKCPSCGASIDLNATECKYCGEAIAVDLASKQYKVPKYQSTQAPTSYDTSGVPISKKNKTTAGILAILLGGLGIHKFYLGKIGLGILYIIFCWTYIPSIIGIIEGIIYLTSSDEKFYSKYARR